MIAVTATACTHLHGSLIASHYKKINTVQLETPQAKIQIIVTRGPFYFTHSALRIQSLDKLYFWDPSGAYGSDEYAEYFHRNPLPKTFYKAKDLISQGAPSLATYWLFAKHTTDLGMEVFEWELSNEQALYYQSILLTGSLVSNNQYDFSSQATFLLCSSALSRYVNRFVAEKIPLTETYFFPDSLAHRLYELNPDRIIIFKKGSETQNYNKRNSRTRQRHSSTGFGGNP